MCITNFVQVYEMHPSVEGKLTSQDVAGYLFQISSSVFSVLSLMKREFHKVHLRLNSRHEYSAAGCRKAQLQPLGKSKLHTYEKLEGSILPF